MTPENIRRTLASYQPSRIDDPVADRAAVAIILRETAGDSELLFIQRATRDHDPWSGHMAFPGGRRHPEDADLTHTAVRETREEVGIDLHTHGEAIGRLDELYAMAHLRRLGLIISPCVYWLRKPVEPVPDVREVQSALWVPLSFLRSETARGVHRRADDGMIGEYPAFQYLDYTIWGLTHRMLEQFLHLLAQQKDAA